MLAYLNRHTYVVIVVVLILVGRLVPDSNLLVLPVTSSWLLLAITIITTYPITTNGCAPMYKESRSSTDSMAVTLDCLEKSGCSSLDGFKLVDVGDDIRVPDR